MADPRSTRRWRQLRDKVITEEPTCWLRLPGICTNHSQTADHIIPIEDAPHLALERTNLRGICHPCNQRRSSMPITAIRIGGNRWNL